MDNTFTAFWKYDLFPFVLSGTVTQFSEDSKKVQTEEYGVGHWFTYNRILPNPLGKEVAEKLQTLRLEKRVAQEELDKEFKNKLKEIYD